MLGQSFGPDSDSIYIYEEPQQKFLWDNAHNAAQSMLLLVKAFSFYIQTK